MLIQKLDNFIVRMPIIKKSTTITIRINKAYFFPSTNFPVFHLLSSLIVVFSVEIGNSGILSKISIRIMING